MSIIDWSDPEEMLGLLADYIRDEWQEEQRDRERAAFLRQLSSAIERLTFEEERDLLADLRAIHDAQPEEFARDPALVHVSHCIEELERIAGAHATLRAVQT